MKSLIVIFIVLVFLQVAYAAGGAAPDGVPWGHIGVQAFNFGLLLAVLIYYTRKPVKELFSKRLGDYLAESERAENEMKAAQAKKQDWLDRTAKLENTAADSIARAKAESANQKQNAIAESEAKAKQLKIEADRSIQLSIEKSKSQLQRELLAESMSSARDNLKSEVNQPLSKELNSKFFEKIKVAQQ